MSLKQSRNIVGFFRLLTSCSLAIKSISHCQWSWSGLDLNEDMLALLLLWDLQHIYTLRDMESILRVVSQLMCRWIIEELYTCL